MKCDYCGSNLGIEDELCPHCGNPNTHARQHSEAMRMFNSRFRATEAEVRENTRRFNRFTVTLTVLAVLVALNAIVLLLIANSWLIEDSMINKSVARNMKTHVAALDEMMVARDYRGIEYYANMNNLTYSEAMRKYDSVFNVVRSYNQIQNNIIELFINDRDTKYSYMSDEELIEYIARNYEYVYDLEEELDRTWGEPIPENAKVFVRNTIDDAGLLLKEFFGVTDDDLIAMRDMTTSRRALLLEEAYSR